MTSPVSAGLHGRLSSHNPMQCGLAGARSVFSRCETEMWRVTRVFVPLGALSVGLAYAYGETGAPPNYITTPVERGAMASLVQATGTGDAQITVDVSSQLSGRMADVFVNFNDVVKAGQPLAELDQEIFVARVNEAKA